MRIEAHAYDCETKYWSSGLISRMMTMRGPHRTRTSLVWATLNYFNWKSCHMCVLPLLSNSTEYDIFRESSPSDPGISRKYSVGYSQYHSPFFLITFLVHYQNPSKMKLFRLIWIFTIVSTHKQNIPSFQLLPFALLINNWFHLYRIYKGTPSLSRVSVSGSNAAGTVPSWMRFSQL